MKGQIPEARSHQSAVVHNGYMYIFGGRDGRTFYADLHGFCFGRKFFLFFFFGVNNIIQFFKATNMWTKLETRGALVKRRYRHSAVIYDRKMYIFGGEFGSGDCYNDFYEFNFGTFPLFYMPIPSFPVHFFVLNLGFF